MGNVYRDKKKVHASIDQGEHREVIGGLWEEMGQWQLNLLRREGLKPDHYLLDVGCGSLRGGVKFIDYLDPHHYFGLDVHDELLDAGYEGELAPLGLTEKLDRDALIATETFDVSAFSRPFDYAIAQSVFTHISLNQIRRCLIQLSNIMRDGGVFYATYFSVSDPVTALQSVERGHGITTSLDQNPYHYTFDDMVSMAAGLSVNVTDLGQCGHPRGQSVLKFVFKKRMKKNQEKQSGERILSAEDALGLKAGADHYRAFVGPPRRFDFMSATQFSLLHTLGLRDEDYVLDMGCGSLRLGRLLIPFSLPGRYFGIDPEKWLIEDGIARELGQDAIDLKQPRFAYRSDFDATEFDTQFDYIIAQSVATHTGPDMLDDLFSGASKVLGDNGLFLFSYIRDDETPEAGPGWHYPACVSYSFQDLTEKLGQYGLVTAALPWFHPAASWMIAAKDASLLPSGDRLKVLDGRVLERRGVDKGYVTKA